MNLKDFRNKIEPFTFFYYPVIPLVHKEWHTQLSPEHMAEYNELCKGLLSKEELEKMEKKK